MKLITLTINIDYNKSLPAKTKSLWGFSPITPAEKLVLDFNFIRINYLFIL